VTRDAWALLLLVATSLVSAPARGQVDESAGAADTTVVAPDPVARARELFVEGTRAMDQGRFELAIEHLEASLEAAARPATAFDLAIAHRGAGHPTQAVTILQALLAGNYGALHDAQRTDAEALRTAAAADVASVRVRVVDGEDIELRIDGLRVDDVAPGAWIERSLDPGRHAITATASARVGAERVVLLERGTSAEVDLALAPELRPGTLAVVGTEPDLQVEIVGIARGRGQVTAELPPGEYIVRATSSGGASETRIEVPSSRTVRLQVSGRGGSVAEEPWFWVVLTTSVLALAGAAVGIAYAVDPWLTAPVADPVFGVTITLTTP
jgi:hypothetical protein